MSLSGSFKQMSMSQAVLSERLEARVPSEWGASAPFRKLSSPPSRHRGPGLRRGLGFRVWGSGIGFRL